MRWDPSVRTRHLTISIALVLLVVVTLIGFTLTRLTDQQFIAKRRAAATLTDQLTQFAQAAILQRAAVGEDPPVVTLIEATVGPGKEFSYCLLINNNGELVASADPLRLHEQSVRILPLESAEKANGLRRVANVLRANNIFEIKTPVSLDNRPFLTIITGVAAEQLRSELASETRMIWIVSAILIGLCILIATFSGGFVLQPLRELVKSIEQLEAEANAQIHAETARHAASPAPDETVQTASPGNDMQNITQRLRELGRRFAGSRTEIEAIRDQLQQVVGNLTERVLLLDREQRVLMASPEAEKLLSSSVPAAYQNGQLHLQGRKLAEVLARNHPLTSFIEKAYKSNQSLQEMAALPANGTRQPQAVLASLQLFQDRGLPAGALLTLRDFETIQRLETQLDFASKVAALNRITAGVAHEVKNPLHSMVLHLELLTAKLDAGLDPKQHLDILTSEVKRLTRVVQTFLDFTRPVDVNLVPADANTLLREVILLAADARAQGVDLIEHYGAGPLLIKADPDLLKQSLLNIIINACQAMAENGAGGKLTVSTGREKMHQQEWVYLSITDTGPGIAPEVREKIFNLYFTTKPQGSGIGLAQAFRAVQLHNGHIHLESEMGKGTTFKIQLPKA